MEDLTGKLLGPYQVVDSLGEGGMAAVYKAYQPSVDRYVALKILPRHFSDDPEFIQRFKQEARVIANLQHPHILPVHDFGEAEGYTYMAMRFIRGGELGEWLEANRPLSLAQNLRIISQIGDALDYAHSQDVIHRDVKPSNVLLDERGNCLLTDFGLAKMIQSSVKLTRTGGILGTPAYMSPEQGLGHGIDHRSDIYSLGVILYEMVTGRPPYQAETPMAIMIKHINDPLPPPHKFNPDLPDAVTAVVLKALAKNKEERFATAGEMVQALHRAVETETAVSRPPTVQAAPTITPPTDERKTAVSAEPVTATPTPQPTATAKPAPQSKTRRPWLFIGIGAILIVILAVFLINLGGTADPADIEPFTGDIPPEIDAILTEAYANWDNDDLAAALAGFDEAIALEPGIYDLHCQRGDLLDGLDELAEAKESYDNCRQIAQNAGDDEVASYAFGQATYTQMQLIGEEGDADLESLRAVYNEALTDPLAPDWLYCERGELSLGYADNEAALSDFEHCLATTDDDYWPERSEAVINMLKGQAALEDEDYLAAVGFLQRWAELDPEGPWAFCSLGYAYTGQEAFAEAQDAFSRCIEIAGAFDDPELQREAESGRFYALGQEAWSRGQVDEAAEAFRQAIELSPDNAWLYCSLGEAYWELDELDDARDNFQECLNLTDDEDLFNWARSALDELN